MPQTEKTKKKDLLRVAYAATSADADRMTELLNSQGIEAVQQGGTRDIYTVSGRIGIEIMVPSGDLEQAEQILQNMPGVSESGAEKEREKGPVSYRRGIISLAAAVLLFILLIFIRSRIG